jgi:stearoyl-CoA desaturase (delta-9 desaturase)
MGIYGILDLSLGQYVLYTLLVTHITIASVTIFLHRCQAHRSIKLHASISHFFRLWLWLTTGMETKAWTAIHRKHHAYCEKAQDPHSPQVFGLNKVLWYGAELYRAEAKNQETLNRFGNGTPNDWLEKHLYSKYSAKGIFVMLFINLVLIGIPGMTVWAIQMMWIPFFAAGVINGLGHFWGYRNFSTTDTATNISPVGLLIGGEELHNNHHAYPASAKLSMQWWEFDIGWLYIRMLSMFGLARVKHVAPQVKQIAGRTSLSLDILSDLIANRIQVVTAYYKLVLFPIFDTLKISCANKNESLSFTQAKSVLIRGEKFSSQLSINSLQGLFRNQSNHTLEVAYALGKQLQELWEQNSISPKELLEKLQNWCYTAKNSNIPSLQHFVDYLLAYQLVPN